MVGRKECMSDAAYAHSDLSRIGSFSVNERATIVYCKGRVWVEDCLPDADVLICQVSATRRGDVLRDVLLTRRET